MSKFSIAGLIFAVFLLANFAYWQEILTAKFYGTPPAFEARSEKMRPNFLIILSLGIAAPIIEVEEASEVVFQDALRHGLVHYPGTADVGEPGNAYIFGHSSDYPWAKGDYKTVFARLPQIKKGEKVIASNEQGKKFVYEVVETRIVSPNNLEFLSSNDLVKRRLTLQTSYPLGTALARFLVIAEAEE